VINNVDEKVTPELLICLRLGVDGLILNTLQICSFDRLTASFQDICLAFFD